MPDKSHGRCNNVEAASSFLVAAVPRQLTSACGTAAQGTPCVQACQALDNSESSKTYPYPRGLAGPEIVDTWGLNGPQNGRFPARPDPGDKDKFWRSRIRSGLGVESSNTRGSGKLQPMGDNFENKQRRPNLTGSKFEPTWKLSCFCPCIPARLCCDYIICSGRATSKTALWKPCVRPGHKVRDDVGDHLSGIRYLTSLWQEPSRAV